MRAGVELRVFSGSEAETGIDGASRARRAVAMGMRGGEGVCGGQMNAVFIEKKILPQIALF